MTTSDPTPLVCHDVSDVVEAVSTAVAQKQKLRVRGAGHSYPSAIVQDPGPGTLSVVLDPFQPVPRPGPDGTVTVWAGTHLGPDPRTSGTNEQNTLLPVLFGGGSQQTDFALADTGGIIHQTVGGFLSTGSSGGTTTNPVDAQIEAFDLVGADGTPFTLKRSDGDPESGNPFFAAGVSLGLLGVVTSVTIRPRNAFYIAGQESITTAAGCKVDLFGPGSPGGRSSLQTWLTGDRFTRLTWWPQPQVGRFALWEADEVTAPIDPATYVPKPYQELGYGLSVIGLIDAFALHPGFWKRLIETVWSNWTDIKAAYDANQGLLGEDGTELANAVIAELEADRNEPVSTVIENLAMNQNIEQLLVCLYFTLLAYRSSGGLCQRLFTQVFESEKQWEDVYSPMIMKDLFITLDSDDDPPGPQTFHDTCWHGLPMDNQIIDGLMPTEFTELWIPIDQTQQVMTLLRDYYDSQGYAATGSYACEVYGAAPSDFWLSPSQGPDPRVRIDLYYFMYSPDDPATTFYPQFWKLLYENDILFRPHWGKHLPPSDSSMGWQYLRAQYPRMQDFLSLRAQHDPNGLFLSDYWMDHLGVGK